MQRSIPYMQYRGGSSKGLYFCVHDLPADPVLRDRVLIAAMGSGQTQIDGLGGGTSLTSKVAIVGPSSSSDADVEYLFAQVAIGWIPLLTAAIFWQASPHLQLSLA